MKTIDLEFAGKNLEAFYAGKPLTHRIAEIEDNLENVSAEQVSRFLTSQSVDESVLGSAFVLKALAGQINVVIHTVGILVSLPHILETGEMVEYVSLGAGNTGKDFDLETDRRVAEFKFINWQGGAEAIRQNQVFKDLFYLAEYDGEKQRLLYVIGKQHPLRFLSGRRGLSSILSHNEALRNAFYGKYGERYQVVSDYYRDVKTQVEIVDLQDLVPFFRNVGTSETADRQPV